ncbi:hypothetical protein KVR01_004797 [Diaporthe batatas]|uniref:uncharacterized protein n=1 Tax=Diaporthe batatas TaxID=748121 RepID=UPI001D040222|nr:uncharacterized protein KVR01_004797 [Diaporthe batatas]KAG8166245.1 hypothetical protein KVR01_004797 [Diaporthe batatas]
MGLYKKLPEDLKDVDVIIAGGGTSGCVVAARLADADPNLSILIIEAGQDNDMPTISCPAMFLTHLMPDSTTTTFYATNPTPEVADRPLVMPSGSVLGGGSSVNMMAYSRGQRCDWDSWGMPGWSTDEMMPFFKKLETFHGEDPKDIHGHDGPINVSFGTYGSERIDTEFLAAAEKAGWPEVPDIQDLESINSVGKSRRYISTEGKRQDVATCYLRTRLNSDKYPNLHVLVESQVLRVLIDEETKTAVGVELRTNPRHNAEATGENPLVVKASKLVVVSSGACGTPALLERSGLGDSTVLERAGIPVVVNLPGVGNGYEDHHLLGYPYLNNMEAADTLDGVVFGRMGSPEDLMKASPKILGWNAQQIQGKVRPTDEEVAELGPEFQKAWDKEFKNNPDKPLAVFSVVGGFPGNPALTTGDPCLSITAFTVYPFSRGDIHITGPKVDDPVDFVTGFFTDEHQLDVKKHIWMYKKQREVIRRMPMYRGEMAHSHPPFDSKSDAACVTLDGPLPANAPPIKYTAEDDKVLERFIRENVSTTWHSLGTCKMLPREQQGVVDARLGVYGVRGLKIADLSVAPKNFAANTNHAALSIGEKAADIFIRELGLHQ